MNTGMAKTLALVFALVLMTVISTESEAQKGAWKIGPRTLPVPVDVSDVMRESLLKTPAPDVEAAKKLAPQTRKQWEEWISERDAKTAVGARALAKALSVAVEHRRIGGVNVHRATPAEIDPQHKNNLFVYLHGGAYILNSGEAGTTEAVLIAARVKMPVLSVDYRMPPEHPAPGAINDVVTVWKHLLKDRPSASLALGGTSAGGGLTIASVHRFKELNLDLPGALYLGTPGADVDKIGDSRYINEGIDRILVTWDGLVYEGLSMYAGDYDHKHHYISPVYGSFDGFPPSYLISGTRDLLLSDTVRVHRKLRAAGVDADLHIYEGQSHGDYLFVSNSPESYEHYAELNAFLLKNLKR
jgi:monoterpene epsilon-lactone hydrolase